MKITYSGKTEKETTCLVLKRSTAMKFGGRCIGCNEKYNRSFAFHHMDYIPSEKTRKYFPDTIDYNIYILPIVNKNPNRFKLVCMECHTKITIFNKMNFSKHRQFYALSKYISKLDIPECYLKLYIKWWSENQFNLKKFMKLIFIGKNNHLSKKILDEIDKGSLDNWPRTGLDEFFWSTKNE